MSLRGDTSMQSSGVRSVSVLMTYPSPSKASTVV